MDLYLDPITRDIPTASAVRLTSGVPEAAAQRLVITLSMYAGEWFLDLTRGVQYYRDILVKNPDLELIRSIFRSAVVSDAYVSEVTRMDVAFDTGLRNLVVEFDAILLEGSELSILLSQGEINGLLVVNGVAVTVNGVPITITV